MKKERIEKIFTNKGGEGVYTKIFENLLPSQKDGFVMLIADKSELPLIGFYKNDTNWLLLTNQKIYYRCEAVSECILLNDLVSVDVDFTRMQQIGANMNSFNELEIENKSGEKVILRIESGLPLSGLWNVLLHICWFNQKS